ncbi:MAG: NHLP family bacteriocin export ABC transporter peptidase/permease/ATPase subunit [Proteobacteria bacterium]|nr:NHLP family bacteriocin export ABC transporter peptidase/permease/ATPase subunit [Pseudomonadota bacterium]
MADRNSSEPGASGRARQHYPARVRTPTVLQLEAVECGAAALAMVLAHHGRVVPLAELRRECGVSRDGSKASNVVKAARRYGLVAKGYSKSMESLASVTPPYIVYWNFNHFVTCEGFDAERVYLNDPAMGHRSVTHAEFDRAFTGVVLVFEPGPEFKPGGQLPGLFEELRKHVRNSLGAIGYCVLAGLLLVLPTLAVPAFNQVFIDHIVLESRSGWLRPLLAAMLVAIISHAVLEFLQLRHLRRLKIKLAATMSSRYLWHLLHLPASFYAQRYAGDVANRSALNDKLAELLSGKLAHTSIDVVMMGFYAALMLFYDVGLTLLAVAFAALNGAVLVVLGRKRGEANMRVLQEYGKADGVAIAGLQSIETLKASGLESGLFAQWAGYYAKATGARQELELANRWLGVLPSLCNGLSVAAILVFGGMRVVEGSLTIGMLVALQSLTASFLAPVSTLVRLGGDLQVLRGDLARVNDVLGNETIAPSVAGDMLDSDGQRVTRLDGYLDLRGVSFGYSPLEEPLLEDLNLSIAPGQRVALVGGSGSGKSTVGKLVSGELQPWSGEVLFDGLPRVAIPGDVMRNSFATVDQDINLFAGTVRDNLTLWDATVPEASLRDACRDAAAQEFISELVGGFDSELLEGGVNLSGGQRQRLEIARALVRNPSLLVLDEATSALDAETEAVVMEHLRMRGCTAVLVAHRLSTVRDCDEIIVFEDGEIVERGTHDELWQRDGAYAHLMRADQEPTLSVDVAELATDSA